MNTIYILTQFFQKVQYYKWGIFFYTKSFAFFTPIFFYIKKFPFFTPKFLFFYTKMFPFFTPTILLFYTYFLHQILKFRKKFLEKNWCKKSKNWCKKFRVNKIGVKKVHLINALYRQYWLEFLGYRETAFSHAILAAGITHAVANACIKEKLPKSPCIAGDDPNGYDPHMTRSQRKQFEVSFFRLNYLVHFLDSGIFRIR